VRRARHVALPYTNLCGPERPDSTSIRRTGATPRLRRFPLRSTKRSRTHARPQAMMDIGLDNLVHTQSFINSVIFPSLALFLSHHWTHIHGIMCARHLRRAPGAVDTPGVHWGLTRTWPGHPESMLSGAASLPISLCAFPGVFLHRRLGGGLASARTYHSNNYLRTLTDSMGSGVARERERPSHNPYIPHRSLEQPILTFPQPRASLSIESSKLS
jgi:hypothetical protein